MANSIQHFVLYHFTIICSNKNSIPLSWWLPPVVGEGYTVISSADSQSSCYAILRTSCLSCLLLQTLNFSSSCHNVCLLSTLTCINNEWIIIIIIIIMIKKKWLTLRTLCTKIPITEPLFQRITFLIHCCHISLQC